MRISDWSSDVCSSDLKLGRRIGDMLRLLRIDRAGHTRLDVAEGAGAGADVAQNHHRRVLLGPALAEIGAGRFLAHGRQLQASPPRTGLVEGFADGSLDANPIRPWVTGCGRDRSEARSGGTAGGRRVMYRWVHYI